MTLKLACPTDARAIARMSRRLIERGLPWAWTPRRVDKYIRHPDSVVLTAWVKEKLSGFAIMNFGDETANLDLLAVDLRYQRLGIGWHLVTWLEESAVVAGTFIIGVEFRAGNVDARCFYKQLGYREVGRISGYYCGVESAVRMIHDLRVRYVEYAT